MAAIMVILFHLQHLDLLSGSVFIAKSDIFVDFFFVLSGFVMTHSNVNKITDIASVRPFVVKRFRRIYPLHLFTLLLVLGFELFRYGVDRFVVPLANPVFAADKSFASFLANLTLTQSLHLFDRVTWNGPSWSISVEFYTYIAWAIALALLRKNVFLLYGLAFSLLSWFIVLHNGTIIYNYDYGFVRCLYSFLIGMLAYQLSHRIPMPLSSGRQSALELLLLGATVLTIRAFTHQDSWLMPLLFAAVIIVFSHERGRISQWLAGDRFEFLGRLSYSYYLNHTVVLAALDLLLFKLIKLPHSPGGELLFVFIALGSTHLMSVFTYRYVELIGQSVSPNHANRTVPETAVAQVRYHLRTTL